MLAKVRKVNNDDLGLINFQNWDSNTIWRKRQCLNQDYENSKLTLKIFISQSVCNLAECQLLLKDLVR